MPGIKIGTAGTGSKYVLHCVMLPLPLPPPPLNGSVIGELALLLKQSQLHKLNFKTNFVLNGICIFKILE